MRVGLRRHVLATILPVSPVPGHRPLDISGQGYKNWIFMSTHYWDEDPQGLWTLGLENKGYYFNTGERVGCGCQAVAAGLGTLFWLTYSYRSHNPVVFSESPCNSYFSTQ